MIKSGEVSVLKSYAGEDIDKPDIVDVLRIGPGHYFGEVKAGKRIHFLIVLSACAHALACFAASASTRPPKTRDCESRDRCAMLVLASRFLPANV